MVGDEVSEILNEIGECGDDVLFDGDECELL